MDHNIGNSHFKTLSSWWHEGLKGDTEINAVHSVIMGIGWRNVEILLVPLDVWMLLCHGIVMISFFLSLDFHTEG